MIFAITGGTGFVGSKVIAEARAAGHEVRALTRRAQPDREAVTWVSGDLADDEALRQLCEGAAATIHIAGIVNAPDEAGFRRGNVEGTRAMLRAAEAARVRRFVHVSSLAARAPELSLYGASKKAAEELVRTSPLDWVMVRPPAVYGPGDTEMLDIYRLAARGWAFLPGRGRFSLVEVRDLARALIALALSDKGSGQIFEIEDGHGALGHEDMARLVGAAVGTRPRMVRLPPPALRLGAAADWLRGKLSGELPKLSFDRARYLAHPDWTADASALRSLGIWEPRTAPAEGIRRTAEWYRKQGWL